MLLNITNHPSCSWSDAQRSEAENFGTIVDLPFPKITDQMSDEDINQLVETYLDKVKNCDHPAVLLQGEFIFTFRLVNRLKQEGIKVMACQSDLERHEHVDENQNTVKTTVYRFLKFREY